jgi:hypothetical protein
MSVVKNSKNFFAFLREAQFKNVWPFWKFLPRRLDICIGFSLQQNLFKKQTSIYRFWKNQFIIPNNQPFLIFGPTLICVCRSTLVLCCKWVVYKSKSVLVNLGRTYASVPKCLQNKLCMHFGSSPALFKACMLFTF